MNPAIITSRAAQDHFNGIKMKHAALLQGIQNQQVRVQAYNDQQSTNNQAEQQTDSQNQINQQKISIEQQKIAQEGQFKQQEYDMKMTK